MTTTTCDLFAEAVIAGCAAASAHGAHLAHQRLTADDFTSSVYAAVFTAAHDLPDHSTPTAQQATEWARAHLNGEHPASIWPTELRLLELADRLNIPAGDLDRLLAIRPVHDDITGLYANRVLEAARVRRLAANTVALHELVRLGDHTRAADIARTITTTLESAGR